jgi:hypothetical protein
MTLKEPEKLQRYIEYLAADKKVYIEKMPEHILRIESLLSIFPKANIIYMERHWLEVAMSIEAMKTN